MTHLASDEEQIRHIITGCSHHVDHRRWQELQALFSDDVTVDYSSLFGGEPQTLSATDLVTGWRTRLSPLRATQHLLGPIAVELRESGANAACHVRGYHFREGLWAVRNGWSLGTICSRSASRAPCANVA